MKNLIQTLLIFFSICLFYNASIAQDTDQSAILVKQGIVLNDAGKYSEAIDKYKQALTANPNNYQADYEIGFTLYASGHGSDAMPYLQNILNSSTSKYEADDLLGSIYDDSNQIDKAVECYQNGIKENPNFEHLHFNLGISYYRQKKYADAEASEVEAIKLDPKHASAQRIYAMATYAEGKRINSLLAWCSFLLLEPQTQRSAEAFSHVHNILNYGIRKDGTQKINVSISSDDLKTDNLPLSMAILSSTLDKKNLSAVDSLNFQLTSVFKLAADLKGNKDGFFTNFYSSFFGKMAASPNMEAFVRLASLTTYKDENVAWFKANEKQLTDLDMWIRANPRSFN